MTCQASPSNSSTKMQTVLTIVIPYYNQPDTLRILLESLHKQTLQDIEVLVIDDASEIQCEHVSQEFQSAGLNVRVIRQPVRSYTLKARLRGMEEAKGEYLAFMDADDTAFTDDAYQKVVANAQKSGADITHFYTMSNNYLGYPQARNSTLPFALELDGKDIFSTWLKWDCMAHSVWNKLYARRLYKKIIAIPHECIIYRIEDFYLTSLFLFFAESYRACDVPAYYYSPPTGPPHLEKLCGRGADAWTMYRYLPKLLSAHGLSDMDKKKFKGYMHKLIILCHGRACRLLEKQRGEDLRLTDKALDTYTKYANLQEVCAAVILSTGHNSQKLRNLYRML